MTKYLKYEYFINPQILFSFYIFKINVSEVFDKVEIINLVGYGPHGLFSDTKYQKMLLKRSLECFEDTLNQL